MQQNESFSFGESHLQSQTTLQQLQIDSVVPCDRLVAFPKHISTSECRPLVDLPATMTTICPHVAVIVDEALLIRGKAETKGLWDPALALIQDHLLQEGRLVDVMN
jgi:hypothetical protein